MGGLGRLEGGGPTIGPSHRRIISGRLAPRRGRESGHLWLVELAEFTRDADHGQGVVISKLALIRTAFFMA